MNLEITYEEFKKRLLMRGDDRITFNCRSLTPFLDVTIDVVNDVFTYEIVDEFGEVFTLASMHLGEKSYNAGNHFPSLRDINAIGHFWRMYGGAK